MSFCQTREGLRSRTRGFTRRSALGFADGRPMSCPELGDDCDKRGQNRPRSLPQEAADGAPDKATGPLGPLLVRQGKARSIKPLTPRAPDRQPQPRCVWSSSRQTLNRVDGPDGVSSPPQNKHELDQLCPVSIFSSSLGFVLTLLATPSILLLLLSFSSCKTTRSKCVVVFRTRGPLRIAGVARRCTTGTPIAYPRVHGLYQTLDNPDTPSCFPHLPLPRRFLIV
jgi:hypothetical protein